MFANIMKSSADAANYIFKSDQAGYNQDLARSQTTPIQTTASQTTTSTQSNTLDTVWEGIVAFSVIIGIPSSLLYLYREGYLGGPKSKWERKRERKQKQAKNAKERTEGNKKQD
jgi:hypothetical protein